MREELDKIEPARQHVLWQELEHITSTINDWQEYGYRTANEWQEYGCNDPNYFIWLCQTQLNYLNAINCLYPDKKHIISGGTELDLWCESRIFLGLRYTASLAKLEELDTAYDAFEDMICIIEQLMEIPEDEFELGCSSPALKGFTLKSTFYWFEENGKEYKHLCMKHKEDAIWIIPKDYQNAVKNSWFDVMRADKRFDTLFERLNQCVVCREKQLINTL